MQATVSQINAAAAEFAQQVADLPLTVKPNGYGQRVECQVCGWSKCYGTVTQARDHAAKHD